MLYVKSVSVCKLAIYECRVKRNCYFCPEIFLNIQTFIIKSRETENRYYFDLIWCDSVVSRVLQSAAPSIIQIQQVTYIVTTQSPIRDEENESPQQIKNNLTQYC